MEKVITIKNIANKSKIKFFSIDGSIDFAKRTTHILVYFNDLTNPFYNLFAELLISANNQPQTNTFDLDIPKGSNSATVVISTYTAGHSLDLIDTKAI